MTADWKASRIFSNIILLPHWGYVYVCDELLDYIRSIKKTSQYLLRHMSCIHQECTSAVCTKTSTAGRASRLTFGRYLSNALSHLPISCLLPKNIMFLISVLNSPQSGCAEALQFLAAQLAGLANGHCAATLLPNAGWTVLSCRCQSCGGSGHQKSQGSSWLTFVSVKISMSHCSTLYILQVQLYN